MDKIDDKIEMILEWMATRKGRKRNAATTREIASHFHAKDDQIDHVMVEAFNRGLIWRHPKADEFYYVRRTFL